MTTSFRFRSFPVYPELRAFIKDIRAVSSKFPEIERFGLGSQMYRAAISALLNLAEGADRATDKEFAQFINRSYTSLNEVVASLDIALDASYITADQHSDLLKKAGLIIDQLTAFRKSLLS